MLPAFFYLAGNLLITYATGIWQAKSRFRTANAWMTGCNLLLIAFIFSGFPQWADSRWKEMLIFIYFLAFLAQGLALIIHLRYQISGPDETFFPKKDELRKLFSYSLVALLANLLFFIAYRVDYVFVARFCSGADLGQYIQVSRIGQLLVTVPSLAATVLFPLAGSDEKLRRPEHITALSRLVFFFSAGCNLIGVLTGWWLFPSLLGKGFEDVYPVYLVLIPGILALSILYPLVAYYSAREMIPVNIRALLVAIVVILTGDFLLIRKFGIYAAASISSLGYICYMVYMMSHFKKMTGTAVHVFFRFRKSDIDAMLILVRQKIK
jgi:O-antigen/teichoic acid export membrane protein